MHSYTADKVYHDCALARFLLRRALRNRAVGVRLYWYFKAELGSPGVRTRYQLYLEVFLRGAVGQHPGPLTVLIALWRFSMCASRSTAPGLLTELLRQEEALRILRGWAAACVAAGPSPHRQSEALRNAAAATPLPAGFVLPLGEDYEVAEMLTEHFEVRFCTAHVPLPEYKS